MVHFTIFGGSEVTLTGDSQAIFTLFGGTEVRKPTLAKRLLREKQRLAADKERTPYSPDPNDKVWNILNAARSGQNRRRRVTFLLTVFGGVEIKPPSIAEEFMDMRELVESGLVSSTEWDQLLARFYEMGELDSISSFTLFGGMGEATPDEEEELKKIRSATELGLISSEEESALRSVVGRDPQQVRALLRQTAFA